MAERNDQATIPSEQFFKSLGKLEGLAKGVQPSGEGDQGDLAKAQLFHTASNSKRTAWPGGKEHGIGNNWDDSIGKDGTDYHPARKAIAEKALKGIPLAPEELLILKGDLEKGEGEGVSKGEGQETDAPHAGKEATLSGHTGGGGEGREVGKSQGEPGTEQATQEPVAKSLEQAAQENATLRPALEMSPILVELVKALDSRMQMMEKSLQETQVNTANGMLEAIGEFVGGRFAEQGEFNKALADVVTGIGHGVAGTIEHQVVEAQQPVGPPKSQMRVIDGGQAQQPQVNPQVVQKSFEGPAGQDLTKSQITDEMIDMVQKGQLSSVEVCKFDMTGEVRPDLLETIQKRVSGQGQR
jgi:hypothetical protein